MNVEISPTRKIIVLGMDRRSVDDLIWCASTYSINRLFWLNGYLLCTEVYEKAFEHEIAKHEFPISQLCLTEFPKYRKYYEVEKGVHILIVNVTGMRIYENLLKHALQTHKK